MKNITKKERAPRITLEDLALMVKKGFDEVYKVMNKRFDEVDKRFEAVEKRLDAIELHLDTMDKRLDHIEAKLESIDSVVFKDHAVRIRRVERKLAIS
jgi:tetrahydromethanopterin S-methyltransferase subunit G